MERLDVAKNARHQITSVKTTPFSDQLAATNFVVEGLSRPSVNFQLDNYTENFVQSVLNVLQTTSETTTSIVVGGLSNETSNALLLKIVRVAAGNKIDKIYTGNGGGISGPAMSYLTVKYSCWGFLIHNSCYRLGGKSDDPNLTIDLIAPNGRPINSDSLSDIFLDTQTIDEYKIVSTIDDLSLSRSSNMLFKIDNFNLTVTVVDCVAEYAKIVCNLFDFDKINGLLSGNSNLRPFRIVIDCNNGAMGPYAKRIFEEELGAGRGSVVNDDPTNDATTFHPSTIGTTRLDARMRKSIADFGAALDGIGGRCVVYGRRGFPVPIGETTTILASHYHCVPDFRVHKMSGVGRFYSSSSSIDDVARRLDLSRLEISDNWSYFIDALSNRRISLCEDDNYGVGSRHVPVKDGIWTILAWLTLVCHFHKPIVDILVDNWNRRGRHFTTIYEFQNLTVFQIERIFNEIVDVSFVDLLGSTIVSNDETFTIVDVGGFNFELTTQVEINGLRPLKVIVEPEGRIIYKPIVVDEMGSIRMIVELLSRNEMKICDKTEITDNLYRIGFRLSRIFEITQKSKADLIF